MAIGDIRKTAQVLWCTATSLHPNDFNNIRLLECLCNIVIFHFQTQK